VTSRGSDFASTVTSGLTRRSHQEKAGGSLRWDSDSNESGSKSRSPKCGPGLRNITQVCRTESAAGHRAPARRSGPGHGNVRVLLSTGRVGPSGPGRDSDSVTRRMRRRRRRIKARGRRPGGPATRGPASLSRERLIAAQGGRGPRTRPGCPQSHSARAASSCNSKIDKTFASGEWSR
jgi:hypothetical protein